MAKSLLDEYTLKARVTPALFVILPYLFIVHTSDMNMAEFFSLLLVDLVVFFVLANVVRDFGVKKQVELYKAWGGKPTTLILRHSDNTLSDTQKQRYHTLIASESGIALPDAATEQQNPQKADEIYDTAVKWLIERTRDKQRHHILLQENISYGFWRNSLAIKPAGIAFALASLILFGVHVALLEDIRQLSTKTIFSPLISLACLLCWWHCIIAANVKKAAYAYAKALLAQSENLAPKS